MIKDFEMAKQISELMIALSHQINESIFDVQDRCSEEEFNTYRQAAARVMGEAYFEVMAPIYLEHPSLEPEGIRRKPHRNDE